METKQQVTAKFITGVALIVISLILGKLVLIPLIIFPDDDAWKMAMLITYAASWVIIIVGIYLAGMEGWKLAAHKYIEYRQKTVSKVKEHGMKAARHTKRAAKRTVEALRNPKNAFRLN
jgi:hypothetical protein